MGSRSPARKDSGHTSGARYAASLTTSVCLTLTLLANVAPSLDPTLGNRRVHVGLEIAAAMVLIFVAAVLLGRFRLNRSRRTLLKFGAIVVLVLDNLFSAVLTMSVDSVASGRFATWAFAGDAMIGAALLAGAALLPDRPVRESRRAMVLVLTASIGVLVANVAVAAALRDVLPAAFPVPPESGAELRLLSEHPALIVVELLTAACYFTAALAFARLADEQDDEFQKWLSIGSVIAGMAFVNYALFPSQFTELVYSGDLFFLAAIIALLYGAVREISREEAAQIRAAVLEERRRVARDLHDGVAQELAFIASQTKWYLKQPDDSAQLGQIMDSVERALDESRGAIAALSRPMDEPLDLAIGHAALDIANRIGARLQLDLEQNVEVPSHWRDALLRITREAVSNAVRHGRARTVTLAMRDEEAVWRGSPTTAPASTRARRARARASD